VNLFWCLGIEPVEKVLQIPFILAVTQIHQLLQLLFETVPQEPIMNPSHSVDINPDNTERLHLLRIKARSDQVYTARVPFILQPSLFKSYVASSVQLSHQSVNVLLRHLIDLFYHRIIDHLEVFKILLSIIQSALDQSHFAFNI